MPNSTIFRFGCDCPDGRNEGPYIKLENKADNNDFIESFKDFLVTLGQIDLRNLKKLDGKLLEDKYNEMEKKLPIATLTDPEYIKVVNFDTVYEFLI